MATHVSNTSLLITISQTISHQEVVENFLKNSDLIGRSSASASQNPDLHFVNELDTPLQIVDVRQLTQDMALSPYQSERSVFVIFQIETASLPAQNALLKSLEEPPEHVQIILTTNRPERVLATILSRCIIVNGDHDSSEEGTPQATETEVEIEELQNTFKKGSYSDLFLLSEKYKDRTAALILVGHLTHFFHQENRQQPQLKYVHTLQALTDTRDLLEKNINVRLALEELFFRLKKTI